MRGTSTRNRSAGDIPRKVPRREILRRFQAKSSVRAKFPRVRTDQLDDAVLCRLPGSLGRPALPATPVTSFTAARHSHVL